MANQFDQTYLRQQKQEREQEQARARLKSQPAASDTRKNTKNSAESRSRTSSPAVRVGQHIRNFFGGNFIRKIDFRKNLPYLLMLFAMIIILIYVNLLTLSNQKKLEELDRERIKLNDKYIQLMDQREMLNVDETRRQALLQVYKDKGFVDDSSIVYVLKTSGKESR